MVFLTLEEIVATHFLTMQRFDDESEAGIQFPDRLEAIVHRPMAESFGYEVHPTLWRKAAALTQSLVQDHPFHNGNKRTALAALGTFLRLNGYLLTLTNRDAEELMVAIATDDRYKGDNGLTLLSQEIEQVTIDREKYEKDDEG
ncbi:death on curing protein [Melghirimyces thermohalophilus]|uniref:Death on curing protein n=1 Tax=Melghirimyces thermohalophilus TaxID=1236220 RepID=A0A1G6IDF8_9BACL|nr:type II toxin-antitoxin system death-on-curing family toxin [Melghirimyces thermohalophilus]SDC04531.1 death on curing protein [Melghirimyces thermohalophilus]